MYILMDITYEKLFYIRVLLLSWLEYVWLVLLSDMSRIVNLSAKLMYHVFIFELASKRQEQHCLLPLRRSSEWSSRFNLKNIAFTFHIIILLTCFLIFLLNITPSIIEHLIHNFFFFTNFLVPQTLNIDDINVVTQVAI